MRIICLSAKVARFLCCLTAVLFASHLDASAQSAGPQAVKVIHFPGGTALPLYVATAKGFFAARGVSVALTPTFNSKQLMIGVLQEQYDIGEAAIDNVVAYQEKQAAPEFDGVRDLVAFMGASSTNLDLIVQPKIHSYADLKGESLAVDAPNTGFAFILREMLSRGGLKQSDYTFVPVGGDQARLKVLKDGSAAGALLTTDFANRAMTFGLKRLGTSLDIVQHYQGTSFFARRAWAKAHRDTLIAFIRALRDADDWIFDPNNRAEAGQILAQNSQGLPAQAATAIVDHLTAPTGGLSRTGAFDVEGIKVVLTLRNRYGDPPRPLDDPSRYVDSSYYSAARSP